MIVFVIIRPYGAMITIVKPCASRVHETTKGEGKMRISIKLFASTIIASGLLISAPAFAQAAPADGGVDEKDIIVTGVFCSQSERALLGRSSAASVLLDHSNRKILRSI
jgi:hypothetical protein